MNSIKDQAAEEKSRHEDRAVGSALPIISAGTAPIWDCRKIAPMRPSNSCCLKGIEAGRIVTKGYGEVKPIPRTARKKGRQKNRRVQFVVLKK